MEQWPLLRQQPVNRRLRRCKIRGHELRPFAGGLRLLLLPHALQRLRQQQKSHIGDLEPGGA